jgi:hypothetical protein
MATTRDQMNEHDKYYNIVDDNSIMIIFQGFKLPNAIC